MGYATNYTTELSGSYWAGAEVTGEPVILTYSFLTSEPTSDPHNLGSSVLNTFTPFTTAATAADRAGAGALGGRLRRRIRRGSGGRRRHQFRRIRPHKHGR